MALYRPKYRDQETVPRVAMLANFPFFLKLWDKGVDIRGP